MNQVFQGKIQGVEQVVEEEKEGQLINKLIDTLQEELKIKDEQLAEKDRQIKELHNLLDQQQQLAAMDRKKVIELEDQLAQEQKEPEKKWWQFWL